VAVAVAVAVWLCGCAQFETAEKPQTICLSKMSAEQQDDGGVGWAVREVPPEVTLH
jgi:ABC-type uncharacterized transport system auxiliary subunit